MTLSTRDLTLADAPEFSALRLQGAQLFPEAFLFTAAEVSAQTITDVGNALASGRFVGVFRAEVLVGFAGFAQQMPTRARHRGEIGPFYVTPDAQGSGAAQLLMHAIIAKARARSVVQLELWAAADNERALSFYAKFGFTQMGRMPRAVLLDGVGQDDLFLVAALDAD